MKFLLKTILFFLMLVIYSRGGVVIAAGNQVDLCGCYSGNYGDFTNKRLFSTYLYSEQDCNQYCANNNTKVYHWTVNGSSSKVTANPGGNYQQPPAHRCSCSNDGSAIIVKDNAVNDENGCVFVCRDSGAKKYNLDDSGWKDVPTQSANAQNQNQQTATTKNANTNANATTTTSSSTLSGTPVGGALSDLGGLVQCGRHGQRMCTTCDLIRGMNIIIQYVMKVAIFVSLTIITLAGVMYIFSGGFPSMATMAKSAITNAIIGFIVAFGAYLMVGYTIKVLGAKADLGINVTNWGKFDCGAKQTSTEESTTAAPVSVAAEVTTAGDAKSKLASNGISVSSSGNCSDINNSKCTSLDGMPAKAVDNLIKLKQACNCDITVTGGTETGHQSHGSGKPMLDVRTTSQLVNFIKNTESSSSLGTYGISQVCTTQANADIKYQCNFWETTEHIHLSFGA